jgi:hypothetical protein
LDLLRGGHLVGRDLLIAGGAYQRTAGLDPDGTPRIAQKPTTDARSVHSR